MASPKTPTFKGPPKKEDDAPDVPARNETLDNTTKKHGIIIPRVGGVITLDETKGYGEAFTGGSNVTPSFPLPQFSLQ